MSSKADDTPGASFQEKSLWITLGAVVLLYTFYFWRALAIGDGDPGRVGALFAGVVVLLVLVIIAGHVVVAARHRPEGTDERDRRIATLGARNAYYVLSVGAVGALGLAAWSAGTFWCAHALLLALVLAEITKSASQLVYYRRGI